MGPYERRAFPLTLRAKEGEARHIVGHASVFDSDSEEMGWFTPFKERVARGAFDDELKRVASGEHEVYALLNHDENYIIAATADRSLSLSVDEVGLVADMQPMDTQTIRDLVVTPIEQGKIRKMSFGFSVLDEHEEKREGQNYRIIDKIGRLFDVSPVTFPAYPATDVSAREIYRSLGLNPETMTVRQFVSLRAFVETFMDKASLKTFRAPDDVCARADCGHTRSMHPDDGACEMDDGCESFMALPVAARKAVPATVSPVTPIGMEATRLRELELHLREFNFEYGRSL